MEMRGIAEEWRPLESKRGRGEERK